MRTEERTKIGLVLESGEAREIHHFCLLVGYGADAINPYLAFGSMWQARREGAIDSTLTDDKIVHNFVKATEKAIRKVMGKMGISTLQSYKGAQIFEAVGLNRQVVERCFSGTASRIEGIGFDVLAQEAYRRHELGYPRREAMRLAILPNAGEYQWRSDGENHAWDPQAIANLQAAAKSNSRVAYEQFAKLMNNESRKMCYLRGLLQFKGWRSTSPPPGRNPSPSTRSSRPRRSSSGSAPGP